MSTLLNHLIPFLAQGGKFPEDEGHKWWAEHYDPVKHTSIVERSAAAGDVGMIAWALGLGPKTTAPRLIVDDDEFARELAAARQRDIEQRALAFTP